MGRYLGLRPVREDRGPVISADTRDHLRARLPGSVLRGRISMRQFVRRCWMAYGGRRVGIASIQVRTRPDPEPVHNAALITARGWSFVGSCDLPLSWPEFNRRAGRFFRDRVRAKQRARSASTTQYHDVGGGGNG